MLNYWKRVTQSYILCMNNFPGKGFHQNSYKKFRFDLFGQIVLIMLKEIRNQQAKDLAKLEINRILVKGEYNGQNITL